MNLRKFDRGPKGTKPIQAAQIRAAGRMYLEVPEVCVARLLSICESDALVEGMERCRCPLRWARCLDAVTGTSIHSSARCVPALWDDINSPESGAANP